jgi:hypothetical protein
MSQPAVRSREYRTVEVSGWRVAQVRSRGVYGQREWPVEMDLVLYGQRGTGRRKIEALEAAIPSQVLAQLIMDSNSADALARYVQEHGRPPRT